MKNNVLSVLALVVAAQAALSIGASKAQAGCIVIATGEPCAGEWSWGVLREGLARLGAELIDFLMMF